MRVTFHGVRGSTPSPSKANQRYGGNTSSVAVHTGEGSPILLDLGTGARLFGETSADPFVGAILVTHLHWDHIQGLPFLTALLRPGASAKLYGPRQQDMSLMDAIRVFVKPPYFPVGIDDLPCDIEAIGIGDETFEVGTAVVTARLVPHVGETLGYRIDHGGRSVVYISDHQQPPDPMDIAPGVVELCRDADVLIHDAQYTPEEFAAKSDWGHCTIAYAVHVAACTGVSRLVLFHHDPSHHDELLDELAARAAELGDRFGVDVISAYEGLAIDV